jgi:hypothetical protein
LQSKDYRLVNLQTLISINNKKIKWIL